MKSIRRLVVTALLAVWCFPAVSLAKPLPAAAAVAPRPAAAVPTAPAASDEASTLRAREKQAQELQDFRGGGVSIYIGSGAALVLLIILLIILL